ncbi:NAD-binding protein [Candidatus Woesearchaeota archaeon]|nr:NAD-binding protein [Candidatus Woesearchaeota archaeon]
MKQTSFDLEKEVPKKVGITLVLIVLLIALGSWMLYKDFGDWRKATYEAISLVVHINLPTTSHAAWSFVLSVLGSVLVLYIIITLVELIYEGRLKKNIEEVRIVNALKKLENHHIICGGGRVGRTVAEVLVKEKKPYVIIEQNHETVKQLKDEGFLVLEGSSLEEENLKLAGIKKAKVLVSCLRSDGDNLLQIMLARDLNPDIKIVARVEDPALAKKFITAGADDVVLLAVIAGKKMAESAVNISGHG